VPQQQVAIEQLPETTAPWVYNLLTNPGLERWERGAGGFSADGAMSADQWQIALGAGGALAVSRDTANADTDSRFCARCVYTHGGARSYLQQTGAVRQELNGRSVAFSARVKCGVPGAVRAAIFDGAYADGAPHAGGGGYETLSVVKTIDPAAGAIRVLLAFEATVTAFVDNAVFVVGAVPQVFVPLHPAEDVLRCQRFYAEIGGDAPDEIAGPLVATGSTSAFGAVRFPVEMASPPTVTVSAPGDWAVLRSNGQLVVCIALAPSRITRKGCRLDATVAPGTLVAGNGSLLVANNTLAARIRFAAGP
jgi:hypothetical protein